MSTTPSTTAEFLSEATSLPRSPASPIREAVVVLAGMIGGLALGVMARLWMRFIATRPEFTWPGTIGIVAGFTIFGLAESLSALAHRRCWRPWPARVARCVGFIGMMPLFVAAGGLMMPTVVGGGLATWRIRRPRVARAACLVVAFVPVILVGRGIVDDFGWSLHSLASISGLIALYSIIVWATRATMTRPRNGWRLQRVALIIGIAVAIVIVVKIVT